MYLEVPAYLGAMLGTRVQNVYNCFQKKSKIYIYIFRLRNGRETLEQNLKEQRIYIHANIAHARAVAIMQRPLPFFFTQGGPKKHHRASELLGRWDPFFRRFREKRLRNG